MKLITFLFVVFLFSHVYGQIPTGYYDNAQGLTGIPLKQALHNIIDGHNAQSYSSLHTHFASTDRKSDGTVWDMYSDIPGGTPPYQYNFISSDQCGNYSKESDCYNREHSWPKSWFNSGNPMYTDLFHLVPTDGYVNGRRGNYPYGEVTNSTWTSLNGCKVGSCTFPGYTGVVFEPIDEYKGDFARLYFYMSVRYYNEDAGWTGSPMVDGAELKAWAADMLKQWHINDTVSQKELDRNNAVFIIQNNRNPFIDNPSWVFDIWGPTTSISNEINSESFQIYPNPVIDKCSIYFPDEIETSNWDIKVFNTTGQEIDVEEFEKDHSVEINTKDLLPGVYFLILRSSNNNNYSTICLKFIK